jgi:hypothetical protein
LIAESNYAKQNDASHCPMWLLPFFLQNGTHGLALPPEGVYCTGRALFNNKEPSTYFCTLGVHKLTSKVNWFTYILSPLYGGGDCGGIYICTLFFFPYRTCHPPCQAVKKRGTGKTVKMRYNHTHTHTQFGGRTMKSGRFRSCCRIWHPVDEGEVTTKENAPT